VKTLHLHIPFWNSLTIKKEWDTVLQGFKVDGTESQIMNEKGGENPYNLYPQFSYPDSKAQSIQKEESL